MLQVLIQRKILTLMLYSIVVMMGIYSLLNIPISIKMETNSNILTIFIPVRGGMSPYDIEKLITIPLEDEMVTLPHLEDLLSVSKKEKSVTTLTFKIGTDLKHMSLQVHEKLQKLDRVFPKNIDKPIVASYTENQSPIMILALSSNEIPPERMRGIADTVIKPALKRVEGVANIDVGGGRERKILVEFDQFRLEANSLSIRRIIQTIGIENIDILSGKLEDEKANYWLRTVGAFKTIEEIKKLPIATTKENSQIYLSDVAEVKDHYTDTNSYSRLNEKPVISLYVQKVASANVLKVTKNVKHTMENIKDVLDEGIEFSVVSDESISIQSTLKSVYRSLLQGSCVAFLILLVFFRNILISSFIFFSVPISLLATLLMMYFTRINMNIMTISGFAIATGLIVDNSIVALENIVRHHKKRKESGLKYSFKITMESISEVKMTLLSSTLTSIIVFVPIIFLNPYVRSLYGELSYVIIYALIFSLITSLTLIPCCFLYVPEKILRLNQKISSLFSMIAVGFLKILKFLFFHKRWLKYFKFLPWPKRSFRIYRLRNMYRIILTTIIRYRYLMLFLSSVFFITCMVVFSFLDREFASNIEENQFTIFVELPSGVKLDISNIVVKNVEEKIKKSKDIGSLIQNSVSRIEGWSSKIYVTLVPAADRKNMTVDNVIHQLRQELVDVGKEYDAFIYFSEPSSSKEFVINVYGDDYDKLRVFTIDIADKINTVPGLIETKLRYKEGQPKVEFQVDQVAAILSGFSVNDIAQILHASIRGLRATFFIDPEKNTNVEVIARLQEKYRKNIDRVKALSLIGNVTLLPLMHLSNISYGLTPSQIWRRDRQRSIQLSSTRVDLSLSRAALLIKQALQRVVIPIGYYFSFGGDYNRLVKIERESKIAFVIMVLLVYAVLGSLFESYWLPIVVLMSIPLNLCGAIVLLALTKTPVTIGAMIGIIMLGGISVNNTIILAEFFNQHKKYLSHVRAILCALEERMKPILITTLTTISGMAPFLIGKDSSSFWKSMSVSVVGGLSFSTIIILFIFPSFYFIVKDILHKLRKIYYE